ncbi:MAG TPA: 3'-5' exonuclease, partial [Chloroflexota bacterium]|nr:3'-5' exonuclease [Chloroflexota bacterium]
MTAIATVAPAARAGVGLQALLHGKDPLPRIVALEPSGADGVILFRRGENGGLTQERDTFCPWLLCAEDALAALPPGDHTVRQLEGGGELSRLVEFKRWPAFTSAQRALSDAGVACFSYASLVTQYLIAAGRTLFHEMRFEEVHRLQVDVETSTLKPSMPGAHVLVAAITDSRGFEQVVTAADTTSGEAELLRQVGELIARLDPDVIEGHNVIDFDLPYIAARAEALGVPLTWGRGGQRVWLQEKQGRLKVGARLLPAVRAHIHGRHILDTYQSVQRFDAEGKLESYALKPVMESLELVRDDREFVDRTSITELWSADPQRLARYCLDDARDVRALAELVTPTDFYQSQIVPRTYQDVATGGTGEKINALMIRAYLGAGHAVAQPEPP